MKMKKIICSWSMSTLASSSLCFSMEYDEHENIFYMDSFDDITFGKIPDRLGQGGTAYIYKFNNYKNQNEVAIKIFKPCSINLGEEKKH